MSLEKAIKHRKEKRKPYYDSRQFDRTCRSHSGGKYRNQCPYCSNGRLFNRHKRETAALEDQRNDG